MIDVFFHPLAEVDLSEAAAYYKEQAPGLGMEFLSEVADTIASIAAYPESGQLMTGDIRRRLVPRFPYSVLYRIDDKAVMVLAVANLRRRPGFWKDRS